MHFHDVTFYFLLIGYLKISAKFVSNLSGPFLKKQLFKIYSLSGFYILKIYTFV